MGLENSKKFSVKLGIMRCKYCGDIISSKMRKVDPTLC